MNAVSQDKQISYENGYGLTIFILVALLAISFGVYLAAYPLTAIGIFIATGFGIAIFFWPKESLLLFGIFVLFQDFLIYNLGSPLSSIDEILILAFILSIGIKKILHADFSWEETLIDRPLLILCIIACFSSYFSHLVPLKFAAMDLFILLKGFFIFYAFSLSKFNNSDLKKFLKIFFWLGFIVLLIGMVDLVIPVTFRSLINTRQSIDYRYGIPSVQSIFTHCAEFGWFMAIMACFCLSFYVFFNNKTAYLLFSLFLLGSFFSMRRKVLIGLFLIFLITIFSNIHWLKKFIRRKSTIILTVSLCFVFGLIIIIFGNKIWANFLNLWNCYIRNSDLFQIARDALYIISWKLACKYFPFGSGLATFGGWISKINYSPIYWEYGLNHVYGLSAVGNSNFICDTFWPYILGQFGIAGCIFYIYIIWKFFKLAWYGIKNLPSPIEKSFSFGIFLVLIISLVDSSGNSVFLRNPYIYFIFAPLGILNSLVKSNQKSLSLQLNQSH